MSMPRILFHQISILSPCNFWSVKKSRQSGFGHADGLAGRNENAPGEPGALSVIETDSATLLTTTQDQAQSNKSGTEQGKRAGFRNVHGTIEANVRCAGR